MSNTLVDLFRHNLWANVRLAEACEDLAPAQLQESIPGAVGSIHHTLWHIAANEEGYLAAIESAVQPAAPPPVDPSVVERRERLSRSGARLVESAGSLDPALVVRGEWRGEPYEIPARIPLLQAVNHGTAHREQIALALTALGIEPPTLDFWNWLEAGMP